MKGSFKLYWVETPSPEENCFVAARSKRDAAKYEEDGTGFDPGDCNALLLRPISPDWVAKYYAKEASPNYVAGPFYVQPEDVHELEVKWNVVEGDDVFAYNGHQYVRQGSLNYIASLRDDPKNIVIRSVADLLEVIARDAPGDWIFRGHGSCRWNLKAGAHRLTEDSDANPEAILAFERELLSEFKRRARIFLQSPPSSDWEWMVLAQHFGLPTRILDWTENPLVALYFSVFPRAELFDDGMLYAYRHGSKEIDIESASDPFAIRQIELIRPPHLDQRVIAQRSVFTAEPRDFAKEGREKSELRYWHVSVNHKKDLRLELIKPGISESSLFPGLASLAAEIKTDVSLEESIILGFQMSRKLEIEEVDAALKRAANKAIHGTREERSGRFQPVQSSMMTSIRYKHDARELDITFTSGQTYRYLEVPVETYKRLLDAESKGEFFSDNIKDEFNFAEVRNSIRRR